MWESGVADFFFFSVQACTSVNNVMTQCGIVALRNKFHHKKKKKCQQCDRDMEKRQRDHIMDQAQHDHDMNVHEQAKAEKTGG
jgi:uncharacterized protein with PIN domain